jgi:hypothetical protein
LADGTSSRKTSNCFATSSLLRKFTPVKLPPGRARLATRPDETGSRPVAKTTGMVVVAAFAAIAAGVVGAAMTATFR